LAKITFNEFADMLNGLSAYTASDLPDLTGGFNVQKRKKREGIACFWARSEAGI
jgi:hypothetical protein